MSNEPLLWLDGIAIEFDSHFVLRGINLRIDRGAEPWP